MNKNELALLQYGVSFDRLSAFAQRAIEEKLRDKVEVLPEPASVGPIELDVTLESIAARLADTEVELVEAWNEISDLKGTVAQLQSEIQKSS